MITQAKRRAELVQAAVTRWSPRRRWSLAVSLMLAFLCSGLAVVPVVALFDYTKRQGDAPATSVEAVDAYLGHLSSGEEIGLRRVLSASGRDELLQQWRAERGEMKRTQPAPDKLTWSTFDVEHQGDDREQITVPVRGVWWQPRGISMQGSDEPWVFTTRREDGGWRITKVRPFPWCGGHVRADACR
jgi:hypothetical protein